MLSSGARGRRIYSGTKSRAVQLLLTVSVHGVHSLPRKNPESEDAGTPRSITTSYCIVLGSLTQSALLNRIRTCQCQGPYTIDTCTSVQSHQCKLETAYTKLGWSGLSSGDMKCACCYPLLSCPAPSKPVRRLAVRVKDQGSRVPTKEDAQDLDCIAVQSASTRETKT